MTELAEKLRRFQDMLVRARTGGPPDDVSSCQIQLNTLTELLEFAIECAEKVLNPEIWIVKHNRSHHIHSIHVTADAAWEFIDTMKAAGMHTSDYMVHQWTAKVSE